MGSLRRLARKSPTKAARPSVTPSASKPIWIRRFPTLHDAIAALRASLSSIGHPTAALAAIVDLEAHPSACVHLGTRAFFVRVAPDAEARSVFEDAFESHDDPRDLCLMIVDENGDSDSCTLSCVEQRYAYLTETPDAQR